MSKTKTETSQEIIPVSIRRIRQKMNISMQEMGKQIRLYRNGARGRNVPATRIDEWEFHVRPTPDNIFTASTNYLLDQWAVDRLQAPEHKKLELDVYYSTVLNRPLGMLTQLELNLSRSRNIHERRLAKKVRAARIAQMQFLESLLRVKMGYVFDPEPGPLDVDMVEVLMKR